MGILGLLGAAGKNELTLYFIYRKAISSPGPFIILGRNMTKGPRDEVDRKKITMKRGGRKGPLGFIEMVLK